MMLCCRLLNTLACIFFILVNNRLLLFIKFSITTGEFLPSYPRYGLATGPILMSNVSCSGDEESLIECDFLEANSSCDHEDDVAVYCEPG